MKDRTSSISIPFCRLYIKTNETIKFNFLVILEHTLFPKSNSQHAREKFLTFTYKFGIADARSWKVYAINWQIARKVLGFQIKGTNGVNKDIKLLGGRIVCFRSSRALRMRILHLLKTPGGLIVMRIICSLFEYRANSEIE